MPVLRHFALECKVAENRQLTYYYHLRIQHHLAWLHQFFAILSYVYEEGGTPIELLLGSPSEVAYETEDAMCLSQASACNRHMELSGISFKLVITELRGVMMRE